MKKLLSFLFVVASIQNSQAGIITFIDAVSMPGYSTTRVIGGVALGGMVSWSGFKLAQATAGAWHTSAIVLIVLDSRKELRIAPMVEFLSIRYPFINDRETLTDLANLLKFRLKMSGGLFADKIVSIPSRMVRNALESSPCTRAQVDLIAQDLF